MIIDDHRFDRYLTRTGRLTSRHVVRDSAYWCLRAEEARALAEQMSPEYQDKMLEIGKVYDDLARQAEGRERLAAAGGLRATPLAANHQKPLYDSPAQRFSEISKPKSEIAMPPRQSAVQGPPQ